MAKSDFNGDNHAIIDKTIIRTLKHQADTLYSGRLSVLARKLKWDRVKLWRLLTGEQMMKLGEFLILCNALRIVPSDLLKIVGA